MLQPFTVVAQGELLNSIEPFQGAEVKPRGTTSPKFMVHLQSTARIRSLIEEVVTTEASKEAYGSHVNNLSFRSRSAAKYDRNTPINILGLETLWMACCKFDEVIRGKNISFHIDKMITLAYLPKKRGTVCKTLNGLLRKILLKYHRKWVIVCLKCVANALSRDKKAQERNVGDLVSCRLFRGGVLQ